jgi:hypothetical protein
MKSVEGMLNDLEHYRDKTEEAVGDLRDTAENLIDQLREQPVTIKCRGGICVCGDEEQVEVSVKPVDLLESLVDQSPVEGTCDECGNEVEIYISGAGSPETS